MAEEGPRKAAQGRFWLLADMTAPDYPQFAQACREASDSRGEFSENERDNKTESVSKIIDPTSISTLQSYQAWKATYDQLTHTHLNDYINNVDPPWYPPDEVATGVPSGTKGRGGGAGR